MSRQAIVTRYFGHTTFRGARVKAYSFAGKVVVSWDHALDAEENHKRAALALCDRYGWKVNIVGGSMPDNTGYAWVML